MQAGPKKVSPRSHNGIPMNASQRIPIALLPGMDGTGELLDALASRLSLSRPVHIISYPLDKPLGYAELTGFAAARLPEGRFAILGESFSGPVAIEIAASRAARRRADPGIELRMAPASLAARSCSRGYSI